MALCCLESARMLRFLIYLLVLPLLIPFLSSCVTTSQSSIADEMMAAYEASQFRVLYTKDRFLTLSPDGLHISAKGEGIYRIRDGTLLAHLNQVTIFSPDGAYVWQMNDGIYRLNDGQRIITTELVEEIIGNGEGKVIDAGDVEFSNDGQYVSVTGQGFYRLSDGQRIIESDARYMAISSDSMYASTSDGGVFRLSDGQQIFYFKPEYDMINVEFSPDGRYVWTSHSLYRLSDQKYLFEVNSPHGVSFTPDMQYAVILENGVYRLSDGQRMFDLLRSAEAYTPISYSADSQYVNILSDGLYRIPDGERLFDFQDTPLYGAVFSPESLYLAINSSVYRLSDNQKLFDLETNVSSHDEFSSNSAYLAAGNSVYRMPSGERVLDTESYYSTFSLSGEYIAFDNDGIYRLSDGQKLFDITGWGGGFTEGETYFYSSPFPGTDGGVYSLHDGYHYVGLKFLNVDAGIMAVGNTIIIIDQSQKAQRLAFIEVDENATMLYSNPSSDNPISAPFRDKQHLAILDSNGDWYQVNYDGQTGWIPSTAGTLFYVPR